MPPARDPLAVLGSYLFFLFLLWLWLRTRANDYLDGFNMADLPPDPGHGTMAMGAGCASNPGDAVTGDGSFGGGGASRSWDGSTATVGAEHEAPAPASDAAASVFDADEIALPGVAVILALGLSVASLYVVYLAPMLFAELLFDGVLSYALYRRLRTVDRPHWLSTAFRRTALPFAMTAVFLASLGVAAQRYAPHARSIGEVFRHVGAAWWPAAGFLLPADLLTSTRTSRPLG